MSKWRKDLDAWERMQAVKNATKNGKVDLDKLKRGIAEINKQKFARDKK